MLKRRINVDKIFGWVLAVHMLLVSVTVQSAVVNSFDRSYNGVFVIYAPGIGQPIVEKRMSLKPSLEDYIKARAALYNSEQERAIGFKQKLNEREEKANAIIKLIKDKDMTEGFHDPAHFAPARHLFDVLDQIKSSTMFKFLKRMPKGGVLHAHDIALCSSDYILSLTYRPNLWQCQNSTTERIQFRFSKKRPADIDGDQWTLVSRERAKKGKKYDVEIKKLFTLYTKNPMETYNDINEVWSKFISIFILITPIVTYAPVWKAYYKQALKEFYDDGVLYLEFRGTLPDLYDLEGNTYKDGDVVQIYYDALNEFKAENPGFIGSKFIYAPTRKVDDETFAEYMTKILELQERFPDYVAGFDIVSQEDAGRPLVDFAEPLLNLPGSVNFFFHAGETNWNGMSTDENLLDAVLLGTKRIGHGYALLKHPSVLDLIKDNGIAIELNPISNQVLKLNDDNRNHPGAFLMSDDYPVVISSDDPSFWEATPLTHDFYIAFMGLASAHADLRTLKQLAINSLTYSSMNAAEKENAFWKWQTDWDEYIEWVIASAGDIKN